MSDQHESEVPFIRPTQGIFVLKGMASQIPVNGFSVSISEGEFRFEAQLYLYYDVSPVWLDLALDHLLEAKRQNSELLAAWKTPDNDRVGAALEAEFRSSIQALTASAIAIDAFYASVKSRIELPSELIAKWKEKRTARHAQIAEVFRRAFKLDNEKLRQTKHILKQLMNLRGMAVHPEGNFNAPILHPQLSQGVEGRFVAFSYVTVKTAVGVSLALISNLTSMPRSKLENLEAYCEGLKPKIQPLVEKWNRGDFGDLYNHQ